MDENRDVGEALARIPKNETHAVQDRLLRALGCRQQLARYPTVSFFQHDIRERAADVDGNAQIADHLVANLFIRERPAR